MTFAGQPMKFDVSEAIGERAALAATYYPARGDEQAPAVLVCLPGGTYSREYWDLAIPGHHGYSFAAFATENGYPVVTIDPLGTGESSRPASDFGFSEIAATLACAVSALPDTIGIHAPPVAVAHSLGGYLAITAQALFPGYAGLAVLGCTNQHVAPLNLDAAVIARCATPAGRTEHAARIDVPVLVGYGVVDVSPDPRAEAGLYRSSPDITTIVLADSAHCHNMASSRHRLWRRLLAWAATVTLPA